ncbi:MAG: hypothetical protein LBE80_00815 [Deltaproteobacteria bacterium]|jgi:hypothetical protein|nr:hypothetical protein [Deltaproteobacteria bacterium]
MTQPPDQKDPNKGSEKNEAKSPALEKAKNQIADFSYGPEFYEVLDSPRFQGLYRSISTVSLPVPGLSSHAQGSIADLDHLYPKELGHALFERESLKTKLQDLLERPDEEIDLPYKARLDGEIQKIDRRLWLHNRRTREAHINLAETLGRGWADLLSTLSRVINNLERLKVNLTPAQAWAKKEIKLELNQLRALVDATLTHLLGLLRNLGQPLDELYQKTHSAYQQTRTKALFSPALEKSSDHSSQAVLGQDDLGQEASKTLDSEKAVKEAWLSPGLADQAFSGEKPFEESQEPLEPSDLGPDYVAEKELLEKLEKFPTVRPKGRKALSGEIHGLEEVIEYLRLFFLARLLEVEETVLSWRGLDEAPLEAPEPLYVPEPPPSTLKGRLDQKVITAGPMNFSLKYRRWLLFFSLILIATVTVIWLEKNKMGKPGLIHAYNGLSAPVVVTVGDLKHPVAAGAAVSFNRPRGDFTITSYSQESFIENLENIPELEQGQDLVYNVAGASPLFEWEAVYALEKPDGPPVTHRQGAPKLLPTDADYVLINPPTSAKVNPKKPIKRVLSALSGVHPARMLDLLEPSERLPVIEAQARWNRPGSLWTPLWLDLLASNSPRAAAILLGRVGDFPRDPWTLGYLLKVLGPDRLLGLCLELEALTNEDQNDPDLAYLASLCLPADLRSARLGDLLKIWPNQPWLNRAAGWELFARDDLEGALWYLDQAFEHDPSTLLPELETLARLRHLHGLPASILAEEFNFWVPGLAILTSRESANRRDYYRLSALDEPPDSSLSVQDQAYILLDHGELDKALAISEPGQLRARLTRLAGASTGASDELAERALALPADQGLDRDTAWSMLGLAIKLNYPTVDYLKVIAQTSPQPGQQIARAIAEGNLDSIERLIIGRDAWLQGQACLTLEIANLPLPEKCPLKARGFLFVGEKPYLTPLPTEPTPEDQEKSHPTFEPLELRSPPSAQGQNSPNAPNPEKENSQNPPGPDSGDSI